MLHDPFNQEITRYRDSEWKIILWSLGLSWGVFLASRLHMQSLPSPALRVFSDLLLIGIVVLGTALLATHLVFVHGELTTNRNWREETRRLLGVYQAPSPFPAAWSTYLHQFESGRDDFVIPFLLFMCMSGLGVSYLIWSQHTLRNRCGHLLAGHRGSLGVDSSWCAFDALCCGILLCWEGDSKTGSAKSQRLLNLPPIPSQQAEYREVTKSMANKPFHLPPASLPAVARAAGGERRR